MDGLKQAHKDQRVLLFRLCTKRLPGIKEDLEHTNWVPASKRFALGEFIFELVCLLNELNDKSYEDSGGGYWYTMSELERMKLLLTNKLLKGEIKASPQPSL